METEEELIKEETRLFVEATDVSVALIEPQQDVHGPFQFGKPDVKAGHARKNSGLSVNCARTILELLFTCIVVNYYFISKS